MCHRRVAAVRRPVRIVLPSYVMVTLSASKVASQPASHNWPMDSSEEDERAGTMCTWRATAGKDGMSSSASWVECMMLPLGFLIAIGFVAGRMLMTGAFTVQKLAVLPVSATASMFVVGGGPSVDGGGFVVAGGPSVAGIDVDSRQVCLLDKFSNLMSLLLVSEGFPLDQLLPVDGLRLRLRLLLRRGGTKNPLKPFILLRYVAASL